MIDSYVKYSTDLTSILQMGSHYGTEENRTSFFSN